MKENNLIKGWFERHIDMEWLTLSCGVPLIPLAIAIFISHINRTPSLSVTICHEFLFWDFALALTAVYKLRSYNEGSHALVRNWSFFFTIASIVIYAIMSVYVYTPTSLPEPADFGWCYFTATVITVICIILSYSANALFHETESWR